jgi:hypothetical protein
MQSHIDAMNAMSLERALFYFIDSVPQADPDYSAAREYVYGRMAVGA